MKNLFKLIGIIVLVMVIGFSMAACEKDIKDDSPDSSPLPTELIGRWVSQGYGSTITYTISADTIKYDSLQNSQFVSTHTLGNLTWKPYTNTTATQVTYPSGYTVSGKVTTASSIGTALLVGSEVTINFSLNATKYAFVTDNNSNFYVKQ